MTRPKPRAWETGLLVVCCIAFVFKLMQGAPGNQWDFRLYYYAARDWAQGVNPYILGNLPKAVDDGFFAFTYPPFILPLFWPFTLVPLQTAVNIYLAIKLGLLAWMVVLWSRILRVRVTEPTWVVVLMFAYSSTIFVDFASGNIVTIEQWLLWLGVAFLFKRRYGAFVAATVAASLFKFTPIVLLAICLWIPHPRRLRYLASGVGAFIGILAMSFVISPTLTRDFFRHVSSLDERGTTNPALLPFILDAFTMAERTYGVHVPTALQVGLYAVVALTIVAITWTIAQRVAVTDPENRVELILPLLVLAFTAAAPRFKVYAYILAIAPTYYVATHARRLPRALPLLLIACLTTNSWMTRPEVHVLIFAYTSWIIAFAAWAVWVYELRDGRLLQDEGPYARTA